MLPRWGDKLLLPAVLIAVGILAFYTYRTAVQVESLHQESVVKATHDLGIEKADRLDKRIIEQDNVIAAIAEPFELANLTERWIPTAQRETPTVRAILVVDENHTVIAFVSRAGSSWSEEDAFRRLLVQRLLNDMQLAKDPPEQLRHLHREYRGQSYLLSYWQRTWQNRRYLVIAWHDVGRIVKEMLPTLLSDPTTGESRINVVDEEGRIIFGPRLRASAFTVNVRFPTTLYGWTLQLSPATSEKLTSGVRNQRLLELAMVVLSCIVIVLGVAAILLSAQKERKTSALRSEFVANVSHELKTPLALVRMFAEMLQSGRIASEEKQREYLDIIVRESERLSNLIENVLDFAKVERGRDAYEFVIGDVGATVSRAVQVYRYRAEREGVELIVDIEPNIPAARIDERAIQLAVINLIDNALKYAPRGDVVTVKVQSENDEIRVRVIDKGPGIAPDERERIFERFVRGTTAKLVDSAESAERGPVRGSGIGLALVRHIAESHGGRAWVESEPGQGSTFVVTVPASPS